jgi:hypothetical protein
VVCDLGGGYAAGEEQDHDRAGGDAPLVVQGVTQLVVLDVTSGNLLGGDHPSRGAHLFSSKRAAILAADRRSIPQWILSGRMG